MSAAPGGSIIDRTKVESILPLAPMQEALLFGALAAGGTRDPGLLQLRCTLRGTLDEAAFRSAWELVVSRHSVLRSAIHWQDEDRPLLVALRGVAPALTFHDLRGAAGGSPAQAVEAFLEEDRRNGLQLDRAPVMRLGVLRVADTEHRLVWTCHHALLDGWSGALVLAEVSAAYEAMCRGHEPRLGALRQWRDFIAWLRRQDPAEPEAFWRRELDGLHAPAPLPFDRRADVHGTRAHEHAAVETELDEDATAALHAFCRRHRLTLGTLVQGAWALLLARHSGGAPPCFGITVSGRAAPVPGIEAMVGVFNNALPVRAPAIGARSTLDFLHALQEKVVSLQAHAHVRPSSIEAWSGARRPFDSLVVFENFPADVLDAARDRSLSWEDLRGGITTGHPLALVAAPARRLRLGLYHDVDRFSLDDARTIVAACAALLSRLPAHADDPAAKVIDAERTPPDLPANRPPASVDGSPAADPAAPPMNALELRLCRIWSRVLGVDGFGVEDDFFEVGGHSLLVARLLSEIQSHLGVRVPVRTFFRAPTIRALARAIADHDRDVDEGARPALLVPLSAGDAASSARPPFFFLHGLQGDVAGFYRLVRHLSEDVGVFGIRAAAPADAGVPLRLEDMAARYAQEIVAQRPQGPYLLGGYCFGGTLAYETARQLSAEGRVVGLVLVIDGEPRTPRWPRETRVVQGLEQLLRTPPGERTAVLRHKVGKAMRLLTRRGSERDPGHADSAASAGNENGVLDELHLRAFRRYRPRRYHGRVSLILARDDPPRLSRWRRAQWSRVAGEVEVRAVPGTHFDLLREPWIRGVAASVQDCLDRAVAVSESPAKAEPQLPRLDRMEVHVSDPADGLRADP